MVCVAVAAALYFLLDGVNRQLHASTCALEEARCQLDARVEHLSNSNERREYEVQMLSRRTPHRLSSVPPLHELAPPPAPPAPAPPRQQQQEQQQHISIMDMAAV